MYLYKKLIRTFIFNRHITFKKFFNFLKCIYYFKFSKDCFLKVYPVKMVIDTGNICNLRCPLCPTGVNRPTREKVFLEYGNFKKIIDEIKDYLYSADLYNWGEPFLNKDIFKIIEYLKESNIRVTISSNLNILKQDDIASMVESGLDELIVSIDGASNETYSKYRINGNFDIVVANLKKIVEVKRARGVKYPKMIWQFLIMKHNEHEIGRAEKLAKEIGVDEIEFRPIRADMGMEILMSDADKIKTAKNWLPLDGKYSRYDYKKQCRKSRILSCLFLKTTMVVNANGSASPCCGVYDEKWDFGNVFKEGVLNVWNNKRYQQARMAVFNKDSSDDTLICSYCIKNGFLEF